MAKKKPSKHRAPLSPDAFSLIFFSAFLLSILSLVSFRYQIPDVNWLGHVGYLMALSMTYLFGLSAYLVPLYFLLVSVRYFNRKELAYLYYDHLYFTILLCSVSFLFTALSETFPEFKEPWKHKVISETVYFSFPYPLKITRWNLGGVPFHFLFVDLPYVNLQKILSPSGTFIIFSSLGSVAFFLLTRIPLAANIKSMSFFLYKQLGRLKKWNLNSPSHQTPPSPVIKKTEYTGLDSKEVKIHLDEEKKELLPLQPKKKLQQILDPSFKKETEDVSKKKSPSPSFQKEVLNVTEKRLNLQINSSFQLPSPDMLSNPSQKIDQPTLKKDLMRQAAILEETLKSFGIEAKVGEIHSGPTITSLEVHPSIGVKVQKIKALENDIALNMEAKSIRIVAPIPGKAAVGVEIPAIHPQEVNFKELLLYYQQKIKRTQIPILLGKAVNGDWVLSDLAKMPHLLIAGATGSGKSVCINTIVMSILMNARPEEIKMLMIDPKKVELTQYSRLPHMIAPVITEPHGAYAALQWLVKEMQVRYEILKQLGLRNISAFNSRKINLDFEASLSIPIPPYMPMIVAIVDEFADLMMVSSADIETPIARIAQMARAVGIHLILATQRPSREVITGIIKANIPTRISFKVASRINSQIVLDEVGAENLLGNGDLLFLPPGSSQMIRAQGVYISDEEINQVIHFLTSQGEPNYLISSFDTFRSHELGIDKEESKAKDPLYDQALSMILGSKTASTTYLQRKLKIGYARAASLMDELESNGIIGPQEGAKPRRVISVSERSEFLDSEEDELS